MVIEDENIQANESFSEAQDNSLRRSQRERRLAIATDYQVYLGEADYDIGQSEDPVTYNQAINSSESEKWPNTMKDEIKSMYDNDVWDIVELPSGNKPISCKWSLQDQER